METVSVRQTLPSLTKHVNYNKLILKNVILVLVILEKNRRRSQINPVNGNHQHVNETTKRKIARNLFQINSTCHII